MHPRIISTPELLHWAVKDARLKICERVLCMWAQLGYFTVLHCAIQNKMVNYDDLPRVFQTFESKYITQLKWVMKPLITEAMIFEVARHMDVAALSTVLERVKTKRWRLLRNSLLKPMHGALLNKDQAVLHWLAVQ
jgi:hypothetical protein